MPTQAPRPTARSDRDEGDAVDSTRQPRQQAQRDSVSQDRLPFVMIPRALIRALSPRALQVYAALACYADADGSHCFPGQARLAADLDVSERTIRDAVAELVAAEALTVTRPTRTSSNNYRLHLTAERKPAAARDRQDSAAHDRQDSAPYLEPDSPRDTPTPDGVGDAEPQALVLVHPEPTAQAPAQAVIGAWVDGMTAHQQGVPPTRGATGKIAREAKQLLDAGWETSVLIGAAQQAGAAGWGTIEPQLRRPQRAGGNMAALQQAAEWAKAAEASGDTERGGATARGGIGGVAAGPRR